MQTKIIKLDVQKPDLAKIEEAARVLDAGGLVGFPTETVYGIASRVKTDSLAKLDKLKVRGGGKYYTLHIGSKTDVTKYVPTLGLRAEKLVKNVWPGPLTIVFELDASDMDRQRNILEREVFESLYRDNSIGVRCPDNPVAAMLLDLAKSPVVAPSANITGQQPAVEAGEVFARFAGQIDLLLDAGPCKYNKSSTVVKIGKKGLEILRPGVYSSEQLEKISKVRFLFVCTGNTCRSPMAEGMFKKYLAEKLGCKVDQLEEKGYKVGSAGTMGMAGLAATPEAVAACQAKGIDIRDHSSDGISERLVEESDFVFVMARTHRERVGVLNAQMATRCVLLAENEDVPDPIGQSQEVYNKCAELIEKAVRKRIEGLLI